MSATGKACFEAARTTSSFFRVPVCGSRGARSAMLAAPTRRPSSGGAAPLPESHGVRPSRAPLGGAYLSLSIPYSDMSAATASALLARRCRVRSFVRHSWNLSRAAAISGERRRQPAPGGLDASLESSSVPLWSAAVLVVALAASATASTQVRAYHWSGLSHRGPSSDGHWPQLGLCRCRRSRVCVGARPLGGTAARARARGFPDDGSTTIITAGIGSRALR